MARKRMIDPEFWSDEEIGQWNVTSRLFYIGLWNFADDEGKLKAHPGLLKGQIFPYDHKIDIKKLKKEVSSKVQWYEVNGSQYGFIRNFLKHQRIDRPSESKLPAPPPFDEPSTNLQEHVLPNIREVKLSKVKLSEVKLIEDILSDLNLILGTSYKPSTAKTAEFVRARLNEGFGLEDFKVVHRKMLKAWGTDAKMVSYLRPITLYSNKFESYLNRKEVTTKLTETGVKAYLIGQEWLRKHEVSDVG